MVTKVTRRSNIFLSIVRLSNVRQYIICTGTSKAVLIVRYYRDAWDVYFLDSIVSMVQSAGLDPAADYALNEIPTWTQPLRMLVTLESNSRLQSSSQLDPFSFVAVWTRSSLIMRCGVVVVGPPLQWWIRS